MRAVPSFLQLSLTKCLRFVVALGFVLATAAPMIAYCKNEPVASSGPTRPDEELAMRELENRAAEAEARGDWREALAAYDSLLGFRSEDAAYRAKADKIRPKVAALDEADALVAADKDAKNERDRQVTTKNPVDFAGGWLYKYRKDVGGGHGYNATLIIQPMAFLERHIALLVDFKHYFLDMSHNSGIELNFGIRYQHWIGNFVVYGSGLLGTNYLDLKNSKDGTIITEGWDLNYGGDLGVRYYLADDFFVDANANSSSAAPMGCTLSIGTNGIYPGAVAAFAALLALGALQSGSDDSTTN